MDCFNFICGMTINLLSNYQKGLFVNKIDRIPDISLTILAHFINIVAGFVSNKFWET